MPLLTHERIAEQDNWGREEPISPGGPIRSLLVQPVEEKGDSIVFRPTAMVIGRFYLAVLKGAPYLYRRISETEVEVYGLSD